MTKKLFFDQHHIEELRGFEFVSFQPEKSDLNPVLTPVHPWETWRTLLMGNCVVRNDESGSYQMWYETSYAEYSNGERHNQTAYATSEDGINWVRPPLGQVTIDGADTSIVRAGSLGIHDANVVLDDRDPDPGRRYKMTFFGKGKERRPQGITVAVSPDGEQWTLLRPENEPVFETEIDWKPGKVVSWDAHSYAGWSEEQQRYVAMVRNWGGVRPQGFRTICYTDSPDFVNWSEPVNVLAPDEHDPWGTEYYYMTVWPYEDHYLGVICVFYNLSGRYVASSAPTRVVPEHLQHLDQKLELRLAYSRDLQVWRHAPGRAPFIPLGEPGAWDSGMVFGAALVPVDGRLRIYYGGTPMRHIVEDLQFAGTTVDGVAQRMCGGFAELRQDGFVGLVSLTNGYVRLNPTLLTMVPRINAVTRGEPLVVRIIGEGGEIAEAQFVGDRVDEELAFDASSLELLMGTTVRVEISASFGAVIYSVCL